MTMKPNHNPHTKIVGVTLLAALALSTISAFGDSGIWSNPAGGSWANSADWSGGVIADGTDSTADFSQLDLTADAVLTLDGARTIGNLIFGDISPDHNWSLGPGTGDPLTLAVSTGVPTVTVNNQAATLGVVPGRHARPVGSGRRGADFDRFQHLLGQH